jgi:hypothetical protein
MSLEEFKNRSLRAQFQEKETQPSSEADLIELDILQETENLNGETRRLSKKNISRRLGSQTIAQS